jgi:hypothetical protein
MGRPSAHTGLETGKVARQADGAVMAAPSSPPTARPPCSPPSFRRKAQARPGFLPADRQLPGKDLRRRQDPRRLFQARRPSERERDADLAPDRPSDPPAVPDGYKNDTQVIITVLQHDLENDPDILALVAASAALTSPAFPSWARSAARASATSTANTSSTRMFDEMPESSLDLVVAGTTDAVLMVESEAKELAEDVMLGAVMFGHKSFQPVIDAIIKLAEAAAKEPRDFTRDHSELEAEMLGMCEDRSARRLHHHRQGSALRPRSMRSRPRSRSISHRRGRRAPLHVRSHRRGLQVAAGQGRRGASSRPRAASTAAISRPCARSSRKSASAAHPRLGAVHPR